VLVVGLGTALCALGEWLSGLGSDLPNGWVAYAPLSHQFDAGLHTWVRLVIWIALIALWVASSLWLLGAETPRRGDGA